MTEIYYFDARVRKFVETIDKPVRPRVARTMELLTEYGNELCLPHSRSLGDGLFELRIVGVVHIRLLYAFHCGSIWIVHGFIKKENRIPKKELDYARGQLKRLASI